ncbi:carbohydrate-binding module family 13 protein, partial [Coprinellus micaceus]
MAVVERGQRYKIVNAKSGTVLDLSSHPPPSSTYTALTTCLSLVNGWNFHGRDNQIWEASEEHGFWHFKNVASGKYLAPKSTQYKDGIKVIASDTRFNWHIWPDKKNPNTLRICIPDTVFNVDLSNHGDAKGGTPVELWGRWEGTNQTWKFE